METEDNPSSNDWTYSDFIEKYNNNKEEEASGVDKELFWDKDKMIVWNQFDQKTTYKGCTAYGLTNVYNGNNVREWASKGLEYKQEDPRWKWEAYQATRGRPNKGSSLQKMMKFFRDRKLIDGNVLAHGQEEISNALANGFFIYTGSNKCNWKATGKSGIFVYTKNGSGHGLAIIDDDGENFIAVNSFGKGRGDNGYFKIPYKYVKYLYTTNVIIDHDNTGSLQEMRDDANIQKAISMGITNGADLDDYATRKEVVLMVIRGLNTQL